MLLALVLVFGMALPALAIAQTDAAVIDLADPGGIVSLVGSALFVVAVVNGLKKLYGLSGQYLVLVAMLVGVGLQLGVYYFAETEIFARVMTGLIYGGGASGLWVLARNSPEV